MAYTTAQITAYIEKLEAALSDPTIEVTLPDGSRLSNRNVPELLKAIAYFKTLLSNATDAADRVDTRTFFFYGGRR